MSDPQKVPKVIEAEKFVIRDSTGTVRAQLGDLGDDSIGLCLSDREGRRRAELLIGNDGTLGLQLWDDNEIPRVILSLDSDRPDIATPALSFNGRDGLGGMSLSVGPDGDSMLSLRDREGMGIGLGLSPRSGGSCGLAVWADGTIICTVPSLSK
jgi:hypothetical protein